MPELVYGAGGSALEFEYLRPFYMRRGSFPNRIAAADLARRDVPVDFQIHEELQSGTCQSALAARTYLLNVLLGWRESTSTRAAARRPTTQPATPNASTTSSSSSAPTTGGLRARRKSPTPRGMSRSYFCRFFRKVTGNTLTEYVLRLRVDQSMRLLASTNQSVTEIAYESGFSSHSYFDRVFRRLTGQAPLQFRTASGQFRTTNGQSRDSRAHGRRHILSLPPLNWQEDRI